MRIAILAIGSRGDVEPYLALGAGLRDAGHEVILATHPAFEDSVQAEALKYAPLAGDPHQEGLDIIASSNPTANTRTSKLMRRTAQGANRRMVRTMRDGLFACRDANLIIASQIGIGVGYHLAERLQLPLVRAFYAPITPRSDYPAFELPERLGRNQRFNLWTYRLAYQLVWLAFRRPMNRARKQVLGLGRTSLREPFWEMDRQGSLLLYEYSPAVAPRPSEWPDGIHVTGYWFRQEQAGWSPPDDLVEFLAAGSPPIYIGFGSMMYPVLPGIVDRLAQAAFDAGQRVVVSAGWAGLSMRKKSPNIKTIGDVPHDWLFPRVAAVIHHGGAGTTAQGLRAGVPTQIIPFLPDQVFWGQCVHELGAGGPALLPSDVDQADLAGVIDQLANSRDMRERAEHIGRQIRSEDGVGRAVELIEDYYAEWLRTGSTERSTGGDKIPSPNSGRGEGA